MVLAGDRRNGNGFARALLQSLDELGVETVDLGYEDDAARIAAAVRAEHADAVELCLAHGAGVVLLRQLLRELIEIGRRDVSIVVHRVT